MAKSKNEKRSFNDSYKKLKEISDILSDQDEGDIDSLITMIKTASTEYENCKERLEAVKKVLEEHMPEVTDNS